MGVYHREWLPPELRALIGVPQEAEFHPEGDAYVHTACVVNAMCAITRREAI